MMPVTFGYTCDECGKGTVRARTFPRYETKIHGNPCVVRDAVIGVCDACGAEYFDMAEVRRWEREYENERYLQPQQIEQIRESLGLTKEGLAQLVGCTRQSIYAWELPDRERAQSRMADLLLKLVARAGTGQEVDVLAFLQEQAELLGTRVELRRPEALQMDYFHAETRPTRANAASRRIAASTDEESEETVLVDSNGEVVARLSPDYVAGTLNLELAGRSAEPTVDVQVCFKDGQIREAKGVYLTSKTALLKNPDHTERDVSKIGFVPNPFRGDSE